MSNLDDFLNDNLSEKKEDQLMKKFVERRMNAKKEAYKAKLKEAYGVTKVNSTSKSKHRRLIAVVLAVLIIALAYFIVRPEMKGLVEDRQSIPIAAYISENKPPVYADVRGQGGNEGLDAYLQNRYTDAIGYLEISDKDRRDSFYLALSLMYAEHYPKANAIFTEIGSNLGPDDQFYPETQLYKVIVLHLLGRDAEASSIASSWDKSSTMWKEYKKIDTKSD